MGIISYGEDANKRAGHSPASTATDPRHQGVPARAWGNQLSLLNHHVSAHIDLNDTDLDCPELINRHGPLSPSALARHAGLHPATITGILDRLQRGGWVVRERDPTDRRAASSGHCATATPSCSASTRG